MYGYLFWVKNPPCTVLLETVRLLNSDHSIHTVWLFKTVWSTFVLWCPMKYRHNHCSSYKHASCTFIKVCNDLTLDYNMIHTSTVWSVCLLIYTKILPCTIIWHCTLIDLKENVHPVLLFRPVRLLRTWE